MSNLSTIEKQEIAFKQVMHQAIDNYLLHIDHYINFIHDRTALEFKQIPLELKNTLDGYGVDELKRFHLSKLIKGEESVIDHYAREIFQAENPTQKLEDIFEQNLFVTEDVYLGRVFKFTEEEKKSMHDIVEAIKPANVRPKGLKF